MTCYNLRLLLGCLVAFLLGWLCCSCGTSRHVTGSVRVSGHSQLSSISADTTISSAVIDRWVFSPALVSPCSGDSVPALCLGSPPSVPFVAPAPFVGLPRWQAEHQHIEIQSNKTGKVMAASSAAQEQTEVITPHQNEVSKILQLVLCALVIGFVFRSFGKM